MMLAKNIALVELIPRSIHNQWGQRATMFIDPRLPGAVQWIRDRFGRPVIVNNWPTGGALHNRGFRPPAATVGATLSQHRFGRAVDFNVMGITPQEVYADIMANQEAYMNAGWTTVEDVAFTPSWTHLDLRWVVNGNGMWVVKP